MSRLVKLGSDGRFSVTGLPPGDHFLAAIGDASPTELRDVTFLDRLAAGAIRLTLGEGEKKVQNIKLGGQ